MNPQSELQTQYDALAQEYAFEKAAYEAASTQAGLARNMQQGICWYPVTTGRNYYNSLNQFVIELEKRDAPEGEHAFEYGRPVRFFKTDGQGRPRFFPFASVVSYVQEQKMVVTLPSPSALMEIQGEADLGIQLYFDETSYKAMFAALKAVMAAKGTRLAELRDICLGNQPAERRKLFPLRFPWLNSSQEKAVNEVLAAKDVAIVHGPPGTGKTTTLVEAIYETLHRETQVLVCAQSNMAVDWISEKLMDRGVNVLRMGNPTRVTDKMLSFTYERRFEAHPDYPELWGIRKTIRDIQNNLKNRSGSQRETDRNRLSRLRYRETELTMQIDRELFEEARVVACTLVGASHRLLEAHHFTTLFIDEAAQALEAASWIAIQKTDRIILAGDHQQLPPTIKCPESAQAGLSQTLMQKIATRKPATVSLLTVQYRMHEAIMGFPSAWFYDNQLKAAPEVKERGILALDTPLVWVDTGGCEWAEETSAEGPSRLNRKEAEVLMQQLQAYIERIGKERILEEHIDFGIISPYKAQVYYLRRLLKRTPFFKPIRSLLTVHTVDGFQGQERDVVLISLVRANAAGQIGFLSDLRRMNVAITRARMKLILLGDASTLTKHAFYQQFYQYVAEKGEIIRLAN